MHTTTPLNITVLPPSRLPAAMTNWAHALFVNRTETTTN
jgi:hypothetical protein